MAELAEGARLLSEYGAKVPSRVRIPLSPPFIRIEPVFNFWESAFFLADTLKSYHQSYPFLFFCQLFPVHLTHWRPAVIEDQEF